MPQLYYCYNYAFRIQNCTIQNKNVRKYDATMTYKVVGHADRGRPYCFQVIYLSRGFYYS